MTGIRSDILLALGANLPFDGLAPRQTLAAALDRLARLGLKTRRISRFYATPCFPEGAGPDYVNAAALVEGDLPPHDVLAILHDVENSFGRRRQQRWGMRTLDVDLLAHGGLVLPDQDTYRTWLDLPPEDQARQAPDRLILPHPRLQDRGFVLVPLADVAPDWRHPVLGLSVREMRDRLDPAELARIQPI